jgi:hypothetical protein
MKLGVEPPDCPLCESAGSVYAGFCQVCLTNVEGVSVRVATPDETLLPSESDDADDRRSDPVQFSEVMDEPLRAIALLAGTTTGGPVGAACQRAEDLLERLRRQFMTDVILGTQQPASVS